MQSSIQTIDIPHLLLAFIPVVMVLMLMWRWGVECKSSLYSLLRMLLQLSVIGYFLVYLFEAQSHWPVMAILLIMLLASSWIALRTIETLRKSLFVKSFIAIAVGGISVLLITTKWVIVLEPWYFPQYMIPLAGMTFANSMTSVSLAAERLNAEVQRGMSYENARNIAFGAALIPIVNGLFAVGLVSLPGMMTGQILSGVSPFIAARYQIMVMCMLFGSTGISTGLFLWLVKKEFTQ
ncbi:MAG: putative ABC transport system permease protein [Phenylobacterium sp.]|jgi:putative ABC transport system permease protein